MLEFFGNLYESAIYRPQLNILQLLFDLTGDIGVSIIILAIIVNLLLWPLFASAYINGQKMKVLQPQIQELRDDFKDNPQQMLTEMRKFYEKHNIQNNRIFLVIIFQLLFATGLWSLTRNISDSETVNGVVELSGLYSDWFGRELTNFDKTAFGFMQIGESAVQYIWLPVVTAFVSYFYGLYTFRIAPKPKILPLKKKKKKSKKDQKNPTPAIDPEALQKSMEFQTMYVIPALMLFLNLNLTVGVNIYFATVTVLSLIRQVIFTNYYASHTDRLLDEIAKSDPLSKDDDPYNDIESTVPGEVSAAQEVPELVIKDKNISKTSPSKKKAEPKSLKKDTPKKKVSPKNAKQKSSKKNTKSTSKSKK